MSAPMKLKPNIDNVSFDNILDHIDSELYVMLCVQLKEKLSREIDFVDDRLAEQLQ